MNCFCRQTVLMLLVLFWAAGGVAGATVEGLLLSSKGAACTETGLIFINEATDESFCVETDSKGEFQLELAAGNYAIYRQNEDKRDFVTRVTVADEGPRQLTLQIVDDPAKSLDAIRDYTVGWSETADQSVADLVNPFPARKQGRLYGSLYLFHRNDNLDARNFFDPVGEPLPEYKRNQFGGTLGFTLTPKLSLQGSYDGLRIIQGSTLLSHVPTAPMKQGDFSGASLQLIDPETGEAFFENRIPDGRISDVSRRVLSTIPDPNRSDPDRNFVNNDPLVQDQNHLNVRADYETARSASLVGEYYYTGVARTRVRPLPAFNSSLTERHQAGSLAYNRALTDKFIAHARLDVARSRSLSLSANSNRSGLLDSLGIRGLTLEDPLEEGYPDIDITGYADPGDRSSPRTAVRNRASIDLSATYVINNHTLRGGVEATGIQLNNYRSDGLHRGAFSFTGRYTGDAFADFLLGLPDSASHGVGSDRADLRKTRWEAFFRDQWRLHPKLQITLGLSYQYSPPYHSTSGNVSGFLPLLFEPPTGGEIVIAGSRRARELGYGDALRGTLLFPDRNDWAPSLSVAFNPLGSNRLVLRGTYSFYYDSPDEWYFIESLGRNVPFYFIESVEASEGRPFIRFDDPFSADAQPELTVRGISPHLRNAYVQYWRYSMETDLTPNWNLEMTYAGRKGTRLTRMIPGNVPTPGSGPLQPRRPHPDFGRFRIVNDGGSLIGHGLDLTAERRMADGMSFRSGFEWNRFLADEFGGDPQNPRDLQAERAPLFWVPRKRFFLNYIVDLPLRTITFLDNSTPWLRWALDGWRLSGITEIRDGRPFSVTISGDPNNDGVYGDRPDRIAPGELPSDLRSVNQWFDTSAFAAPQPYAFGTAGRGILQGPGQHVWDISVIKQTRLSDGDLLEFRVELFNAFNHANFDRPDAEFNSSTFGKIFGADRAREIELALKYSF